MGTASSGEYEGVAPGASLYSVRVLGNDGSGDVSDVIAGLDWVLQNAAGQEHPRGQPLLRQSVSKSRPTLDPLVQAAEAVWDAGVVVVCSAGNYGRDGDFSITSPGNSRKVITVGSVTDKGTGRRLHR